MVLCTPPVTAAIFSIEQKSLISSWDGIKRFIAANVENEWSKFLKTRIVKIGLGFLLLYFISSALLVMFQIV